MLGAGFKSDRPRYASFKAQECGPIITPFTYAYEGDAISMTEWEQ